MLDNFTLSFAYFRRDVDVPEPSGPDRRDVRRADARRAADPEHAQRPARREVRHVHRGGRLQPERAVELGAYYTYEKDATTNQWSTTTGAASTTS